MNYIILDLEWNVVKKRKQHVEITEIGAIKAKEVGGKIVLGKTFHSYVKPTFRSINKETKRLTGIQITDTWFAPKFPKVISRFEKWIGKDKYILCTWGPSDISVLIKNCNYHKLSTKWINKYIDIQKEFTNIYNKSNNNLIGLKKGLKLVGLEFKGRQHSSIDDAVNTANLFKKTFYNLKLKTNTATEYKTKEETKKINRSNKYKQEVKGIFLKRMEFNIGREKLSDFSNLEIIDIAKIERFKKLASDDELYLIKRTLDLLVSTQNIEFKDLK